MSRCGSKCLHETPREAVADGKSGWLGEVGRFKCTVRRKFCGHMQAVTRRARSSKSIAVHVRSCQACLMRDAAAAVS
jgi:hypothetical protein